MKKIMTVLLATLLLGWSLAVTGCATTGMNDSMGTTTEMKGPAMNDSKNTMTAPAGRMMEEQTMESPDMQEAPAPLPGSGM